MNGLLSVGPLMWQRLVSNWRLLLVLAFGIVVAATLMAVSPVYTRVMNDLGLQQSLQDQIGSASRNAFVIVGDPLGEPETSRRQQELAQVLSEEIGWLTETEVRYGSVPWQDLAVEGEDFPRRDSALLAIKSLSGADEHVEIVEGRLAEPTRDPSSMEVLMPVESATYLGLSPGDRVQGVLSFDDCNRPPPSADPEQARELQNFQCTPQTFVELRPTFTVVGFVERSDPEDRFWTSGEVWFFRPQATEERGPVATIILPEQTFFQALPAALPRIPYDFRLTSFADITRLNSANLEDAQASIGRLRTRIQDAGAIPDLAMASPLNSFQNRASFNQVTLLLLLLQVVGIAVYYVVLVSSLLAERRSEEIAMLRSRGATVGQLVAMSAAEAFALGLVAALVAPVIASAAVAALGLTGTFESISGGGFLPFTIVPAAFLFALGGAAIAAIATVVPAFFAARRGMVVFLRSAARPGKSILQRYYLDVGLAGLAGLALWQLNQKGSVFDARSVGGWSADPLLLLSPLLLIAAVGALMFRFLPAILGLVSKLMARTSGPGVMLGLWQLTRTPGRYTQLALLVVMAAAVGTFAATYGKTTDVSQEERALYAVGADVRLTGLGNLGRAFNDEVVDRLESVEGIEGAATAFRGSYTLGPLPNFGPSANVLGLDPLATPELLWFRDDFAADDLRTTMLRIAGSPLPAHGITVPGDPEAISIAANPVEPRPSATLWARTRDANGVFRFHRFGTLDFSGYREMTTPIEVESLNIELPIAVVGIMITQSTTINEQTPGVIFDDLTSVDTSGEVSILDDFEGAFRWRVLPTATREQDEIETVGGSEAFSGSGAVRFSFLTGTNAPIRGMHVNDADIPIPAIVSQRFLDVTGLRVGGEANLVFERLLIPITVRGVVDYFPTMYDGPAGFIVVNQDHLYYYAGMSSENPDTQPSEAWLTFSQDREERQSAQTALLDKFGITSGQIIDREAILEDIRTDPVVRAGGSGILLLALVAAFTILALGFALTLYLGGQARTVEVSVMRAVGISPRQLFAMISLEYLLVAAIGLVVGTIAGLRISETMLSFLEVTSSGARIVPPYRLITDWNTVGVAFAAVGVAFVAGVGALAGYFLRLPVSRVLRITR